MTAPDFNKGFPSAGERIGPAWQAAWDMLADGEWHDSRLIKNRMKEFEIVESTAAGLLSQARKAELVERKTVRQKGKNFGIIRRTPK